MTTLTRHAAPPAPLDSDDLMAVADYILDA